MNQSTFPAGPSGYPVIGCFPQFVRDPIGFLHASARAYGTLTHVRMLGRDYYLVSDPQDIEELLVRQSNKIRKDEFTRRTLSRVLGKGLVTSEDELWRKQRRLVSFAFTPVRIRSYADVMVTCAARELQNWRAGSVFNLHEAMSRLTLDVVAATLFAAEVDDTARQVAHDISVFNEYLANSPEALLNLPLNLPTPRLRRFTAALRSMDGILFRLIAERRAQPQAGRDLLSALLEACDADGTRMNDQQLRDECVTLFIAGHETTALALVHAFHLLATHPEVERRFRAELTSVLGGRAPSYEDFKALPYTTAILKESLRLYPPVWVLGREVKEPLSLHGYALAPSAQLLFSPYIVHRDSRYFPEPEAFRPERWEALTDTQSETNLPKLAYFPFGGGPRVCIGNHFAMLEAVLLMAAVGQQVRFELQPRSQLQFSPAVTLRPKGSGVLARAHRL